MRFMRGLRGAECEQQQLWRAVARCDGRWVRVLTWWRVHKNLLRPPGFLPRSPLGSVIVVMLCTQ